MTKVLTVSLFIVGLGLTADASPIGGGVDEVTCWMWVNTVDIDTGFEWCICMTEHDMLFGE